MRIPAILLKVLWVAKKTDDTVFFPLTGNELSFPHREDLLFTVWELLTNIYSCP